MLLLFFISTKSAYTNKNKYGLVYNGNERVGDLVGRDTDGDGVEDWEETLYGLDPTKKDTNDDGVIDNIELAKIRGATYINGQLDLGDADASGVNLTETDKFSRELFSTLAALNQAGNVDQNTIATLTDSLSQKIQAPPAKKVFVSADITLMKSDGVQAVQSYNNALNKIYTKYPFPKKTVTQVLGDFSINESEVDESALSDLDPIIVQTNNIIDALVKTEVPPSLVTLHLEFLNKMEKLSEDLSSIRRFDSDIVVAMGGISQYEQDANNLDLAMSRLVTAIAQKTR